MGNSKNNNRMNNHIGEYCDTLVHDFFNFCDGHADKIITMVWIDDIKNPMPPSTKQMGILLSRLQIIWHKFCDDARLPKETKNLFISKIKSVWKQKGKEQKILLRKSRKPQKEN